MTVVDVEHFSNALHRILEWMTDLFYTDEPEANARREKVFSRLADNPTGFPDSVRLGPFDPSDEQARRLMLGL